MNAPLTTFALLALVGAAAGRFHAAPSAARAAELPIQPSRNDPDDTRFIELLDASGEGFSAAIAPGQAPDASRPTLILVPKRVHRTLHNELVGVRAPRAASNEPLIDFAGILGPWPVLDEDGESIPAYIDEEGNPDPFGVPNPDAMAVGWYSNPLARLVIRKGLLILRGTRPTGGMELGAGEAMPGKDGDGDTPLFQGVGGKVDGTADTVCTLLIERLPDAQDGGKAIVLYAYSADTLGGHARIVLCGVDADDITFDAMTWTTPSISAGSYNRPAEGTGYFVNETVDGQTSPCFHYWPTASATEPTGQFVLLSWRPGNAPHYTVSAPAKWTNNDDRSDFVDYCKKLMKGAGIPTT